MSEKIIHYIIRFLLGDDVSRNLIKAIGYTSDRNNFHKYNVVIIPSGFFSTASYGHMSSVPELPLKEIEGVPLLYGNPQTEMVGATLVVKADIIASTYFLISRYEEMIQRNVRDEHGRFPGKESLPYRAGFIRRPIVDEYRLLLRKWLQETNLNLPDIKTDIRKVYLTHDVDAPFLYRSWKGLFRSLRDGRGLRQSLKAITGPVENDPYYTFSHILEEDMRFCGSLGKKKGESIYFLKAGGRCKQDKPRYNLSGRDMRNLLKEIVSHRGKIGLHSSYHAGKEPVRIRTEKEILSTQIGQKINHNRHHFLSCREPEDMDQLEAAGISHDFTMGYADVAGYRLGTSYPVRWINPTTRRLSPLILHPLTVMDCTLDDPKYMGLSETEALEYCISLIDNARKVGGDVTLLWHNTVFTENTNSYHRTLYSALLNELTKK